MNCITTPLFCKMKIIIIAMIIIFHVGAGINVFAFSTSDCPDITGTYYVTGRGYLIVVNNSAYYYQLTGALPGNIIIDGTNSAYRYTISSTAPNGLYYECFYKFSTASSCAPDKISAAISKCSDINSVNWLSSNTSNGCDFTCNINNDKNKGPQECQGAR